MAARPPAPPHAAPVTVVDSGREAIEALKHSGADYQLILSVRCPPRRHTQPTPARISPPPHSRSHARARTS
jgi:hypothetical protein